MEAIDILLELARENAEHIKVLNHEYGTIMTDVSWLKAFFWVIAVPIVTSTIAALYSLILHNKKKNVK